MEISCSFYTGVGEFARARVVAWNHTSSVSMETRREVGILKALGFSITDILEIRLLECITLGLFSASLGVFLGIIYDLYLRAPHNQ